LNYDISVPGMSGLLSVSLYLIVIKLSVVYMLLVCVTTAATIENI